MRALTGALLLVALDETAALSAPPALPSLRPARAPIAGQRALLASQALSSWGDRCWEFAAPFFLLSLKPDSLAPVG